MFPETPRDAVERQYEAAQSAFAALGIDADRAIAKAVAAPLSLHAWQGDDVAGLEVKDSGGVASGGLLATGNYMGRARSGDEIRADAEKVLSLAPGKHRFNIHAMYAEAGRPVDRDKLEPKHFAKWIAWAKRLGLGLDFNPTYFSHPKAADGATLTHRDAAIREFWVRHGIASRRIAEAIARELGTPSVNNHWIPDGMKDSPADRWGPRERLAESLDAILAKSVGVDPKLCVDAVEGKLFGLGSEDYVPGSNDFYAAYALKRGVVLTLDMGHFHPTESVADKLSALLQFHKRLLVHVSRPIRWDSDHVVIFNDDLRAVFQELVRGGALDRVYLALDYFDASINRIAAWTIGARSVRKAILAALLEPVELLKKLEAEGKGGQKLAVMEDLKTLPFAAVWNMLCLRHGAPAGMAWLNEIEAYEREVLSRRV